MKENEWEVCPPIKPQRDVAPVPLSCAAINDDLIVLSMSVQGLSMRLTGVTREDVPVAAPVPTAPFQATDKLSVTLEQFEQRIASISARVRSIMERLEV